MWEDNCGHLWRRVRSTDHKCNGWTGIDGGRLQLDDPPIWIYGPKGYSRIHFYEEPGITINYQTLYQGAWKFPGNERIVIKRFKEILTSRR